MNCPVTQGKVMSHWTHIEESEVGLFPFCQPPLSSIYNAMEMKYIGFGVVFGGSGGGRTLPTYDHVPISWLNHSKRDMCNYLFYTINMIMMWK
ncbi:hypothetical protein BLOT_010769 [Blomia tropicalis]|nr:hypothetical protein BLOT_010769 [Blomia tropicalis]